MQIVFLIWPVLLLPVLVAWLTRSERSSNAFVETATPAASKAASKVALKTVPSSPQKIAKAATHTLIYRKEAQRAYREMLELAAEQCRRESPAYRQAAQAAYQAMQEMPDTPDTPVMQGIADDVPALSAVNHNTSSIHKTSSPLSRLSAGNASRNSLGRLG